MDTIEDLIRKFDANMEDAGHADPKHLQKQVDQYGVETVDLMLQYLQDDWQRIRSGHLLPVAGAMPTWQYFKAHATNVRCGLFHRKVAEARATHESGEDAVPVQQIPWPPEGPQGPIEFEVPGETEPDGERSVLDLSGVQSFAPYDRSI